MRLKVLFSIVLLATVLLVGGGYDGKASAAGAEFYQEVSATQANTAVSFGFKARNILIINDGANEIFFSVSSSVATTANQEIKSGESITLTIIPTSAIGIICSTGETATVRVGAWQ